MAKYIILALNGPTGNPGDEDGYNMWYNETHAPELAALEGVKSARRFKVVQQSLPGGVAQPYAALYEIETDDLSKLFEDMGKISPFSPLLDRENSQSIVAVEVFSAEG